MTDTALVQIAGRRLPGRVVGEHRNVHVGVQRGKDVLDPVPADAQTVTFDVPVEVRVDPAGRPDYRGPFVQGPRGRRFVYLDWGDVDADGVFTMFSRAKLNLFDLPDDVAAALAAGQRVRVELDLGLANGKPVVASIPPAALTWTIQH